MNTSIIDDGIIGEAETDPGAELLVLSRALRTQLEWSRVLGATGLERAASVRSVLPATSPADARPELPNQADAMPPVEPEEKARLLAVLAEQAAACTRCALHTGRTHSVFARGTGSSGLCFVGEGPGADEDAQGLPFVGVAGQLLDRMIAAMGFARDEVYVCNVVKCRPPGNRKPEETEMAACLPFLREQLQLLRPQVVVALGSTAVQGLFGATVGITRLRGQWRQYQGIPVMPTFHPAYLLRNPRAKREVWEDLQQVLQKMGRPITPPTQ